MVFLLHAVNETLWMKTLHFYPAQINYTERKIFFTTGILSQCETRMKLMIMTINL